MPVKSKVYLTIPQCPHAVKRENNSSEDITILISVPEKSKPEQLVSAGTKGDAFSDNQKKTETTTKFHQTSDIRHTLNLPSTGREGRIIPRLSLVPKRRPIPYPNSQMRSSIQDYMGYMEKE